MRGRLFLLDIAIFGLKSQTKELQSDVLGAGNFLRAGTSMLRKRYPHGRSGSTSLPLYTGAEMAISSN